MGRGESALFFECEVLLSNLRSYVCCRHLRTKFTSESGCQDTQDGQRMTEQILKVAGQEEEAQKHCYGHSREEHLQREGLDPSVLNKHWCKQWLPDLVTY